MTPRAQQLTWREEITEEEKEIGENQTRERGEA